MTTAPPPPVDPPTLQKEEEELGIGELSYGRNADEPTSRSQSPELDEQEKNLRMHAVGFDVTKRSLAFNAARDVG